MSTQTKEKTDFVEELNNAADPIVKVIEIGVFVVPVLVVIWKLFHM